MFSLSREQVEIFNRDGFLIVERLIDLAAVDALRLRLDALFHGEFETGVTPDEVNWQAGSGDPSLTRQICNGWRADRAVARVVTRRDLGRAIAELGDWPGTRIMQDNVLWKPPGARPLLYHQDDAYVAWYTPSEMISCWIALDDTRAGGGTLEYVLASHRWALSPPAGQFHGPDDYQRYMREAARQNRGTPEIVHVEVPAGGGAFHHGRTWHGSDRNRSGRDRRALVLHGMPSDAAYAPDRLQEGTGRIYARYKRLGDNNLDENYFPVLWRHDGYRTPGLDAFTSRSG